jgi:uncharacterized protein YndB with AHSA1/START domain
MSAEAPILVRVTRRFDAPAERVFDAWLDAEKAGRFLFATPTGQMVRAETDPRVGGKFVFVDRRDGQDAVHTGEYLAIDRPRRLVFRFAAGDTESTHVTVEIVPRDTGCELTLIHEMNPAWKDYVSRTEEGWKGILEGLAAALD